MYVNYHNHTDYSSISMPDVHVKTKDYFERMVEIGHTTYFTTEHGYGGDIFEPFILRDKDDRFKNIKICFGVEAYITANTEEKVRDNYHIVVLARTNTGRRKLNKIISKANKENFYYRARLTVEDFEIFDKDDIYITSACMAGIIRDEIAIEEILKPLVKKFKENIFLEIQNHDHDGQKEINLKALELSKELGLSLVHANDSHYIYPHQILDRDAYLKSNGMNYGDEDTFILDYPDRETIIKRYEEQGVFSLDIIEKAIDNTVLFAECEEIDINKDIKMPNLYKNLAPTQRMEKLENIIYEKWNEKKASVLPWRRDDVEDGIKLELDIVKETNDAVHTADYFLLHKEIVEKAKASGGVLTPTSRGSAGSFVLNYLLGFVGINRFALDVPLYPTRFISKSRLLETRSLPDIDLNVTSQEPFIQATRDLLGENSCYPLIAYGTSKESGAFRGHCRWIENTVKDYKEKLKKGIDDNSKLLEISERLEVPLAFLDEVVYSNYNKLAKEISKEGDLYSGDKNWNKIYEDSSKFVGSINSSSQHPCSVLLMEEDIESELSVIKIGDAYCVPITSNEVDYFKYLKSDFLLVSVLKIIDGVFKEINKPVLSIEELIPLLDDRVWGIYEKGLTATINQVDSNFATNYVMQYKPKSYQELSAFVASIRPGFKSLLNGFLNREKYSTGVDALDEILEDTNHYMLYQESIMKYLVWLGIPEDETYGLISKIAKKTLTESELSALHNRLGANWMKQVGVMDGFEESWQVVDDASKYSFNCSHSIAVAFDSLYGAYLKVNYPLEYYTVALNEFIDNTDKVNSLIGELPKFGIKLSTPKFTSPSGIFSYNKKTNTIYQGIGSMKYISTNAGDKLKELSQNEYKYFVDLLSDVTNAGINSRQIQELIRSGFFDELFPNQKELLYLQSVFGTHRKNKSVTKKKIDGDIILQPIIKKFKEENKIEELNDKYGVDSMEQFFRDLEDALDLEDFTLKEKIKNQVETIGTISITIPDIDKKYVVVRGLSTKYSPIFDAHCLANGQSVRLKVYKNKSPYRDTDSYTEKPFKDGDILYVDKFEKKRKSMFVDGQWREIEPPEFEWWAKNYQVVEGGII